MDNEDVKTEKGVSFTSVVPFDPSSLIEPLMGQSSERALHDHTYVITNPRNLKRRLDETIELAEDFQKQLKAQKMKTQRLKIKVMNLGSVISSIKEKHLISPSVAEVLGSSFSGATKELLERIQNKDGKGIAYPKELKCFAMTLQFYSNKV